MQLVCNDLLLPGMYVLSTSRFSRKNTLKLTLQPLTSERGKGVLAPWILKFDILR